LLIGWGSTYGHITTAVRELQAEGLKVAHAQFSYINPLPKNTADVLKKYKKILVCELNLGQFANYLRMRHPEYEYLQFNKVQGLPFTVADIKQHVHKITEGK
jgi:2-oxoglutarate ferredoxin oxidoreductase subunit alpha